MDLGGGECLWAVQAGCEGSLPLHQTPGWGRLSDLAQEWAFPSPGSGAEVAPSQGSGAEVAPSRWSGAEVAPSPGSGAEVAPSRGSGAEVALRE